MEHACVEEHFEVDEIGVPEDDSDDVEVFQRSGGDFNIYRDDICSHSLVVDLDGRKYIVNNQRYQEDDDW